jgi:hypothetical protein
MRRALRALLPALLLVGCATKVEVSDRDVTFPTLHASYRLPSGDEDEPAEKNGDGEARSRPPPERTWSLEFRYTRASGDGTQTLDEGDTIRLGREDFKGPGVVESDYVLEVASLALATERRLDLGFRLHGYGGLEIERLDLELEMEDQRESDTLVSGGPVVGVGVELRPIEWISARAGGRIAYAMGDNSLVFHTGFEAGAAIRPVKGLSIFGGWRWWTYALKREKSDVLVDLSGPIIGVSIGF